MKRLPSTPSFFRHIKIRVKSIVVLGIEIIGDGPQSFAETGKYK